MTEEVLKINIDRYDYRENKAFPQQNRNPTSQATQTPIRCTEPRIEEPQKYAQTKERRNFESQDGYGKRLEGGEKGEKKQETE